MAARLDALVQADFLGCGPSSTDEDLAGNENSSGRGYGVRTQSHAHSTCRWYSR
jgi:hypothetical protein